MVLDRERHQTLIQALRDNGVRIKFLSDGDVAGAIATAFPETGIDLYLGSGGAPEGVLAAAALKCLGGEFQGRLIPENQIQYDRCVEIQNPLKVLTMEDLVGNDDVIFAATGVTNGEFLEGVRFLPNQQAETHSVVMRAQTRTIRFIKTIHYLPNKTGHREVMFA